MNNLTPAEEFLKGQIGSFEYPYNGASWLIMEKSLRRRSFHKYMKWASGIAVFTAAVVTVVCFLPGKLNNQSSHSCVQNISNQINGTSIQHNEIVPVTNNNIQPVLANKNISHNAENNPTNNTNTNSFFAAPNDSTPAIVKKDDLLTRTHSKSPCPDFSMSETSGCSPLTVIFIPAEKCDSMIYSWDFGDGKISTDKQPVHSFKKSGKYTVRLMVKYFRSDEMKTRVIENAVVVYSKPDSDFDLDVDKNTVYMKTIGQDNKYTWVANDTVSSGSSSERTYMKNGKYKISLISQNSYGCSDTLTKNAEIDVPLVYFMPTSFTPFKEGPNKLFGPFSDNSSIVGYQMEIINSRGQVVFSKKGKDVNWDGYNQQNNQPCEPGLYHYKLKIWDKYGNIERKNGSLIINNNI